MTITTKQTPSTLKLALMAAMAVASVGLASSSQAASATATASGTVVSPIAIAAAGNLAFGSFAAGAGGTVTVSTSGVRATTGPVLMGTTSSAARFNITGMAASTYSISHSGSAVLTNTTGAGGETMALAKFSDFTAGNATSGNPLTGTLDASGAQSLYVGGALSVAASQVPGLYVGTVIATVEYN
ncbi:MAG: DUF4402 domain-containing protein [Massilia sp.]|nr:DUF4402 domain-containing protein [Massilia sp.]